MQISSLLLLCGLNAKEAFVATARDMAIPPTINGQLGDNEWNNAAKITNFSFAGSDGLAEVPTDVYIAFDKKALYFGFYCQNVPGAPAKAITRDRDDAVYLDDAIEIMVRPDLNSPTYYHFVGNSAGSIYDANGKDSKWNGDWTYKVTQGKDHWEAEVCIPFKTLGIPVPAEGQSLGLNVGRDLPSRGPTSWTGAPSFHDLETFGRLQFSYVAPIIQAERITGCKPNNGIRLAKLCNTSSTEKKIRLDGKITMESDTLSSQACVITLSPKDAVTVELPSPSRSVGPGSYSVALQIEDEDSKTRRLLYRQSNQFVFMPSGHGHLKVKKYLFHGTIEARFSMTGLETDKLAGATAEFHLLVDDKKAATRTKVISVENTTMDVTETFDIAAFKPGRYTIQLQVCDKNKQTIVSESESFDRPPQPEWIDSKLGISDEVLPPWVPLKVTSLDPEKVTVSCWGRDYYFEGGVLPAQVRNQKKEMLTAPMVLRAKVNGHEAVWRERKLKVLENKPNRVVLRGEIRSEGLVVQADTTLEYDGMGRVDLHLTGASDVQIEDLTLEIPMLSSRVPFIVADGDSMEEGPVLCWPAVKNGRLPDRAVVGGFTPMIWLGDDYRGLMWFAESPRNWSNRDEQKMIELVPDHQGSRVLKIHFVDDPIKMDRPLDLTFGFQATPVKKAAKRQVCYIAAQYDDVKKTVPASAVQTGRLVYPAKGNLQLKQGAIQLWVHIPFDPRVVVDPAKNRADYNQDLLRVEFPNGHQVGFYWNIDERGMVTYARTGDNQFPWIIGSKSEWKANEEHVLTLSWGEELQIYSDGILLAKVPRKGLLDESLENAKLVLTGGFDLDAVRVLSVPFENRTADALTPTVNQDTLLLDTFDKFKSSKETEPDKSDKGCPGTLFDEFVKLPGRFKNRLQFKKVERPTPLFAAYHRDGIEVVHFHEHWTETQGYPKTIKHQDQLLEWVKAIHENQLKAQLYLGYQIGDNCPEYKLYKDEILCEPMKPWMKWARNNTDPPHTAYGCSYSGPWANFMLFELEKLIRKYDIDALYLDGTYWPTWDMNGAHGAGYVDRKGIRRPVRQIFAYREWMKRLRTMVNRIKPGFRIDMHDSTAFWIPTLSFGDSLYTGERTGADVVEGKVTMHTPEFLDVFRASFSGTQYGFPVDFMVTTNDPTNINDAEAVSYLHGTYMRFGRYFQICRIYKEWGVDEARWLPYFDNADYVKIKPSGVKGSLYYQEGKSILLVISNLSESKAMVEVDFDAKNIHLPPHAVAQDLLDNSVPQMNGHHLRVNLEPWRLYLIGIKEVSNHEDAEK